MRQFTDEEIKNCRKIAEKGERKTVEYGDWCYSEIYWPGHGDRDVIDPKRVGLWRSHLPADENTAHTPLWQEHDCLEWLKDKFTVIELWRTGRKLVWMCRLNDYKWWKGETPLEALLRAVLAIIEEK